MANGCHGCSRSSAVRRAPRRTTCGPISSPAKCENIANLKLASTALYRLADSGRRGARASFYTAEAIAAILAEAKEKRVDLARADAIAKSLRRQSEPQPADKAAPAPKPDSERDPAPTPTLQPALPREAAVRETFVAVIAELEALSPSQAQTLSALSRPIAWKSSPSS
jgi:hypothetical protein